MIRRTRWFAPALLATSLFVAFAPAVNAQAPAPAEGAPAEEGTGDPVPGYVATGFLVGAAIFVICKSARR